MIDKYYEIHIGQLWDLKLSRHVPKQLILITEDQKQIIEHFANVTKDSDLNNVYRINDCEFRIMPHIEIKSRCCGRCDGINDICVTDMVCDLHKEQGCEICYGKK